MHNEKELVDQCLKGNPKSQEALYKQYAPRMYGVCMRYARNTLEADDILQETWLKAITSLAKFEPRDVKFSAWLFAIARRKIEADPARPVYLRTVWGEGYLFSPRGT
mgnify:CR=1 FL=1